MVSLLSRVRLDCEWRRQVAWLALGPLLSLLPTCRDGEDEERQERSLITMLCVSWSTSFRMQGLLQCRAPDGRSSRSSPSSGPPHPLPPHCPTAAAYCWSPTAQMHSPFPGHQQVASSHITISLQVSFPLLG